MYKLLVLGLLTLWPCLSNAQAVETASVSNRIKWATASELNNFGFEVYRGDAETGPFEKISENTIPGAGSTDTPTRYEYIDKTIEAEKAYWYYVESISMSGVRKKFTPTLRSTPKSPAPGS